MKTDLVKKYDSLKSAIERYNLYYSFIDIYKKSKSLDTYIEFIKSSYSNLSEDSIAHYDELFRLYHLGNDEPLLTSLYNKLLTADDNKNKIASELKAILREL